MMINLLGSTMDCSKNVEANRLQYKPLKDLLSINILTNINVQP